MRKTSISPCSRPIFECYNRSCIEWTLITSKSKLNPPRRCLYSAINPMLSIRLPSLYNNRRSAAAKLLVPGSRTTWSFFFFLRILAFITIKIGFISRLPRILPHFGTDDYRSRRCSLSSCDQWSLEDTHIWNAPFCELALEVSPDCSTYVYPAPSFRHPAPFRHGFNFLLQYSSFSSQYFPPNIRPHSHR